MIGIGELEAWFDLSMRSQGITGNWREGQRETVLDIFPCKDTSNIDWIRSVLNTHLIFVGHDGGVAAFDVDFLRGDVTRFNLWGVRVQAATPPS